MYEYHCVIDRVVDGDTVDVDIDLGFGVWLKSERVRISNIDAPETRTRDLDEKAAGLAAKEFVESVLPVGSTQTLVSREFKGKFGRILGDFRVMRGSTMWDLSNLLISEGHASQYR